MTVRRLSAISPMRLAREYRAAPSTFTIPTASSVVFEKSYHYLLPTVWVHVHQVNLANNESLRRTLPLLRMASS